MINPNQSNNADFKNSIEQLLKTVKKIRGPDGCPWDKTQTHASLAAYAIEEAFELAEVLDQIHKKNTANFDKKNLDKELIEELGDYLFQVLLHCEIKDQEEHLNQFETFNSVVSQLELKLIHRHPHVFTENKLNSISDVWKKWEEIKLTEKKDKKSIFTHPLNLPALQAASKIGQKAKTYDFDWPNEKEVFLKVKEELCELEKALENNDLQNINEEIGDLLFSISQLARHFEIDAEQSLRQSNMKFMNRFAKMINLSGHSLNDFQKCERSLKESLWNKVKKLFG